MSDEEFEALYAKVLEAIRTAKPPSREEQLRYAFSHGPEDHALCYICGKESCRCWRD